MTATKMKEYTYKPSGVKIDVLSTHDEIVRSEVPALNRVNLNAATPEMLTQILKGVGLKTATEIYELKQSLPGERFTKLDQLRSIKRVDWDAVLADDNIYVE
jgi:DNA uptake protein ComE-like DNA-binding protein